MGGVGLAGVPREDVAKEQKERESPLPPFMKGIYIRDSRTGSSTSRRRKIGKTSKQWIS